MWEMWRKKKHKLNLKYGFPSLYIDGFSSSKLLKNGFPSSKLLKYGFPSSKLLKLQELSLVKSEKKLSYLDFVEPLFYALVIVQKTWLRIVQLLLPIY